MFQVGQVHLEECPQHFGPLIYQCSFRPHFHGVYFLLPRWCREAFYWESPEVEVSGHCRTEPWLQIQPLGMTWTCTAPESDNTGSELSVHIQYRRKIMTLEQSTLEQVSPADGITMYEEVSYYQSTYSFQQN